MSLSSELTTQRRVQSLRVIPKAALAAATGLVATVVLVVLPVTGSPSNVAAAATLPTSQSVVVGGDISCGPTDSNFSGSNSSTCQQRATASLIHSLAPNYLIAGGDTQYTPTSTEGVQPQTSDYTAGYGGSWAGLQTSGNANFVPGLVVRPTPGDHEYGDANETDRGAVSNASNYYSYFGSLGDLPAGVTGPSNDFYSFDVPLAGGTWHVITLDSECAALPATVGGSPSQTAAGCASGSPEETFLRNDLIAHQGDCTLIHFHEPEILRRVRDQHRLPGLLERRRAVPRHRHPQQPRARLRALLPHERHRGRQLHRGRRIRRRDGREQPRLGRQDRQ